MRLYSSTFLSLLILFFFSLGQSGHSFESVPSVSSTNFETVFRAPMAADFVEPLSIKIYTDFTCAPCRRYASDVVLQLRAAGLPVEVIAFPFIQSDASILASASAQCAGEQQHFWEMHDWFFSLDTKISQKTLSQTIPKLGMDGKVFDSCLARHLASDDFLGQRDSFMAQGIQEVPTTVLGPYRLVGDQPYENIMMILKKVHFLQNPKL